MRMSYPLLGNYCEVMNLKLELKKEFSGNHHGRS